MKNSNKELEEKNKELQKKLEHTIKLLDEANKANIELKISRNKLTDDANRLARDLNSSNELLSKLYLKYEQQAPEVVIVSILEGLQVPEQVTLLKNLTSKKVTQFRELRDKHARAAKFYGNNVDDLKEILVRASDEHIVTLPDFK